MANTKSNNQTVTRVFMYLSVVAAFLMATMGALAAWTNNFTTDMVKKELSAQKIYFPEKGTPALDPQTYPDLQKYAGQLVDTPEEAKAYANGYIGRHLKEVAGGKVYSEVSAESRKNPENAQLQAQKQTLFQGETLRGLLLGNGYAFGTIGKIAGTAAVVLFVGAALMLVLAAMLRSRI